MSLEQYIGQIVELRVERAVEFGYFLTDGNEDVLLHQNETEKEYQEGEEIAVFLYSDSRGRITASAADPAVTVNQYAWVPVVEVKPDIGVFLDIGIQKDILLGEADLPLLKSVWPQKGNMLYITLRVNRNNLLFARPASEQVIVEVRNKAVKEDFNKDVNGFVYRTAKVGSWVFTEEGFKGFVHESQRKREPRLGEKVAGRIIEVKEDGTVNLSFLPRKQEALGSDSEKILEYLQSRNGAMPYWDKSLPEDIEQRFSMSKASFKRALGKLMKEGKVYQEEGWTYFKKD